METNKIYQGDCLELMKQIEDNSIDLVVTSPPYDNLRDYKGYSFDFENIAKELHRIIKGGGIIVWIVGDTTKDFCESLTSFKQANIFVEIGLNLLDTMIYVKKSYPPAYPTLKRYANTFEFMFIFCKGKPKTFNPIKVKKMVSSISEDKISTFRGKDGFTKPRKISINKIDKAESNVWVYDVGFMKSSTDRISFKHPATFPEQLAEDHILSWSNKGDIVLDPMCGSGTTCKMALKNNRKFIGFEISEEYVKLANKRIEEVKQEAMQSEARHSSQA